MINLTEVASCKIKKHLDSRGTSVGIKIGVKMYGCSGMSYSIGYVDAPMVDSGWISYSSNGVTIWVNESDIMYVSGITIDWRKDGLNESFYFINPKQTNTCGCGKSFRV